MAIAQLDIVLEHVRKLVTPPCPREPMDGQLLARFAAAREEAAFATLVQRYGPLVLGVCRRVLCHEQDAEDAFQATFLVLARHAAVIRKQESVGSWLYGVAHRVALKAKAEAARRHVHLRAQPGGSLADPLADLTWRELCAALDEELTRLPDKYRAPLLLCYMEGKTQDEAAAQLGWARGTLKRRLERGREILRGRLLRRGLTLSASLFAAALAETQAAVPTALVTATIHAANAGTAAGTTAGTVGVLAESATPAVCATKFKIAVGVILMLTVVGVGAGISHRALAPMPSGNKLDDATYDLHSVRAKSAPGNVKPADRQPSALIDEPPKRKQEKQEELQADKDRLPAGKVVRLGEAGPSSEQQGCVFAFHPHGKLLAVTHQESVIFLHELAKGVTSRKFAPATSAILAMAFSPDGKKLASVGTEPSLSIWDTATGKVTRRHKLNASKGITALAFTRDMSKLALATQPDQVIKVFDVDSGKISMEVKQQQRRVLALAFAPDGKTLAASTVELGPERKRFIDVCNVVNGKTRHLVLSVEVSSLQVTLDGKTLVGSSPTDGVYLWDLKTGKETGHLFRSEASKIDKAAVSKLITKLGSDDFADREAANAELGRMGRAVEPLLRHALDKQPDHEISRRLTAILKKLEAAPPPLSAVKSLAVAPDGKNFAFAGATGLVRVSDQTGKLGPELSGGSKFRIMTVKYSADGSLLAGADRAGVVRVWETKKGKLAAEFGTRRSGVASHERGLYSIAFSPDGKSLATTSSDNTLRLWDLAKVKECLQLPARASGIGFTPDGNRLLAFGDNKVWGLDTATRKRLVGFEGAVETLLPMAAALSPDGATLAVGGHDGTLLVWDAQKNVELRRFRAHPARIVAVAFAPDGQTVATASGGTSVYLWDTRTGRFLRAFVEKKLEVRALAFAPDGKTLAAGSQDGVVRIWDVAKAYLIRECTGPKGEIVAVAFSPDGKTIASGGPDGTTRLWEAATGKERQRYREHLAAVTALAFSPTGRRLASGSADRTAVVWDVVAPKPGGKAPRTRQQTKDLWDDLASDDAGKAYQAVHALAAGRTLAVPFFKARMQPIVADARRIARLIADLDDDAFAVRERATVELEKMGMLARPALSRALATKPPLEARRRLQRLLDKSVQEQVESIVPSECLRTLRALEVLERIGTPEARQVLRAMAEGTPEAWLTQEAKAALNRGLSPKR
jgi:RNA polymerase sigma factor (sigma-70 family)